MNIKTLISATLTSAVLGSATLAALPATTASAAEAQGKQDITLGYVAWADQLASTNALKVVLEDQGYRVKATSLSAAFMWQGLAQGKLDMISAWLPTTHATYYKPVKDKVDNLGHNFEGTRLGLVVPSYMKDVNTIDDLKAHAAEFDNRIVGIDPGAGIMRITKDAIGQYGLGMKLTASSDATMTAVLGEAIRAHKPVVATAWVPHWMFNRWDLKFLDDPKNAYGAAEQLDTVVRKGLKDDSPKAYCVLSHFKWTSAEMGELLEMNEQPNSDPYQNAKQWVAKHPDIVKRWTQDCQ